MAQTPRIVQIVKAQLKQRGITYRALARELALSESAVKQMFASGDMNLSRLDRICEVMAIDITDLMREVEADQLRLQALSVEQEKVLVSNPKLLLVAYCLVNHWSFDEITAEFDVSETEGIQLLARLDRMKLIELLPGNRVKPLIAGNFTWQAEGPIEQYFRNEAQGPFFDSSFNEPGCARIVKSGNLTTAARQLLCERLAVIGQYFDDLVVDQRSFPLDQRSGSTMVLAVRNWEFEAFTQFKRR